MTRVRYRVAVEDRLYDAHTLALACHASLSVPANQCRLVLHPAVEIAPLDSVEVALTRGDGEPAPVFSGTASAVEHLPTETRVVALGRFLRLIRARVNMSFQSVSAGDIAAEVLGMFDIDIDTREPGVSYPGYTIADDEAAYWVLSRLARSSGFEFYADRQDRAIFGPLDRSKGEAHALRYGRDLVHFALQHRAPAVTGVEVHGQGAASFAGARAHSWLTTRAVRARAGTGAALLRRDPALRDLASVQTAAQALLMQQTRSRDGWVRVGLRADIGLGDAVVISDRRGRDWRGQVTGVCHRVSKRHGALTDIDFISTEGRE